jgi:hypothetical protein
MCLDKKKNKALESVNGAIQRFRSSLTKEDEEGWKFYREVEYAFNDMVARAKMICGCQHCANPNPNSTEPQYCYCSGSKQVECKCR